MSVMTYSPDLIRPDLSNRRNITLDELMQLDEPAVIREYAGVDDDGERFYAYTVAGWLGGENIATIDGGCTVGNGDVIIISADSQDVADDIAGSGLQETIQALLSEKQRLNAALDAVARLESVGAVEILRQAMRAPGDRSDLYTGDMAQARTLRGDDILLSAGHIDGGNYE